ncbi:sulfatase-like hydrolase/transferase [Flammeovirga yaeyamensis]|uniref:Sulfatase-like hydrolase/transferase n=1 Tax=Flammeovirga yaeyamensis TaxID=367791 RepID=A0AAX1NE68_9BACT|nr:sulfatase [Flammeovirga yaeyamensis]MBB3696643.1 arylsulfatase A-like enzyme [Flammeovirga yaeyamensis]NMF33316.1 sulfatase [Flammeovirga yaeyamensis]QWG05406.1 sulfatase-like hydrolase/transferase [Flammeovirga yaeyamensis]
MKRTTTLFLFLFFYASLGWAQEKNNVLIFLVDDLRPDLGCYGNTKVKSPNIDKLANEGITFNHAYAQQGICAPSRMSILTSKRVDKIGVYSIFTPLRSVQKDMMTMPQFFKSNGYKTISIGKVYHHIIDDKQNWSLHIPKELNTYASPENQLLLDSLKIEGVKKGPAFEAADVADEGYKDGRASASAIKILKQIKKDPFMMVVGLSKPHLPFNAPKKYWDLYDPSTFDIPLRKQPTDVSTYATTHWGELRGYYGMPKEGHLDDETTRTLIHGYYASVSYIDAQVGKILNTLEELDLRKNTIVVFMSDHGWKLGEYGDWCKHTNFELDTRVPLIMSRETAYKKSKKGLTSDALVENIDVFPTVAAACGLDLTDVDGKSLLPLLDRPKKKGDAGAYSLYARGDKIMGLTVTDGAWRYTEWRDLKNKKIHSSELYACQQDYSIQNENLVDSNDHEKVLSKMKDLLYVEYPKDQFDFLILKKKSKKKS